MNNYYDSKYLRIYHFQEPSTIYFFDDYIEFICGEFRLKYPNEPIEIRKINVKLLSYGVDGLFDKKKIIYVDKIDDNLCHELIHFLFYVNGYEFLIYFDEGLAEMFKKPIGYPNILQQEVECLKNYYFSSFKESSALKYGIAGLLFRFIYECCGSGIILDICQGNTFFFDKIEEVFGTTTSHITEIFNVWKKNINGERFKWYGIK